MNILFNLGNVTKNIRVVVGVFAIETEQAMLSSYKQIVKSKRSGRITLLAKNEYKCSPGTLMEVRKSLNRIKQNGNRIYKRLDSCNNTLNGFFLNYVAIFVHKVDNIIVRSILKIVSSIISIQSAGL